MFSWIGRFKVRMAKYDADWFHLEQLIPHINELAENPENLVISKPLWSFYLSYNPNKGSNVND